MTENEFLKREVEFKSAVKATAPYKIRTSHLMFKSMIFNLVNSLLSGSESSTIEVIATG